MQRIVAFAEMNSAHSSGTAYGSHSTCVHRFRISAFFENNMLLNFCLSDVVLLDRVHGRICNLMVPFKPFKRCCTVIRLSRDILPPNSIDEGSIAVVTTWRPPNKSMIFAVSVAVSVLVGCSSSWLRSCTSVRTSLSPRYSASSVSIVKKPVRKRLHDGRRSRGGYRLIWENSRAGGGMQ